jgi:hypothetical protein
MAGLDQTVADLGVDQRVAHDRKIAVPPDMKCSGDDKDAEQSIRKERRA